MYSSENFIFGPFFEVAPAFVSYRFLLSPRRVGFKSWTERLHPRSSNI